MAYDIQPVYVWVTEIEDRAGGLSEALESLAETGANLEFVSARSEPERPGKALLFVAPLAEAPQTKGDAQREFWNSESMFSLRVQGPDRPGLGLEICRAVSAERINLRGLTGATVEGQCVMHLVFSSKQDRDRAGEVVREALESD